MAGEQADQADQAEDMHRRTVSSPTGKPEVLDRSTFSDDGASKAPSILNFKRVLSVDSGSSFLADLAASQQRCPVRALLVRVQSTSSETRVSFLEKWSPSYQSSLTWLTAPHSLSGNSQLYPQHHGLSAESERLGKAAHV